MQQTGRDVAELHYVVVDDATCAAVVFDDNVALDGGVPRARTSTVRACRTSLEFVAFFRKHRAPVKCFLMQSRHFASWIDNYMGVYELDSLTATVSRCTSALEFSSKWPGCQRFHRGESRPPQADQKGRCHPRNHMSLEQEGLAHKSLAPLSILRCDFACPRFLTHRRCGRSGRETHVPRESASDDAGVARRWLSKSREEHVAARSNTTGHHF